MLVLIVEDEADLAELTIDFLETENIECDYAANGEIAVNLLQANEYDVIVLDVAMPKKDGFSVCQWLRAQDIQTPVIFLTARDSLDDKLQGFSLGADDYLTKPFDLEELAVRIKLRAATRKQAAKTFRLDNLHIDFSQQLVMRGNRKLALSATQWQLLKLLAEHSPAVVKKTHIERSIWPDQDVSNDMYKMMLSRLRNLVDASSHENKLLHTMRGIGAALRLEEQ